MVLSAQKALSRFLCQQVKPVPPSITGLLAPQGSCFSVLFLSTPPQRLLEPPFPVPPYPTALLTPRGSCYPMLLAYSTHPRPLSSTISRARTSQAPGASNFYIPKPLARASPDYQRGQPSLLGPVFPALPDRTCSSQTQRSCPDSTPSFPRISHPQPPVDLS